MTNNNDKEFNAISLSLIKFNSEEEFKKSEMYSRDDSIHSFECPVIGEYNRLRINFCGKQSISETLGKFNYSQGERNDGSVLSDPVHTFHAIIDKKSNSSVKSFFDKKDNNENKNYFFVSMISLNYSKISAESAEDDFNRNAFIEKIERIAQNNIVIGSEENRNYLIFYSLDSFDILFMFWSSSYKSGAKLIRFIDAIPEVVYSYSLLGYDDTRIEKYGNETISKITICGVINNNMSFNEWYKKVSGDEKWNSKCDFIKYFRMGNEDVIINIKNADIKSFLSILNDDHFYNKLFYEAFMNCRIHIDDIVNCFPKGDDNAIIKYYDLEKRFKEKYNASHDKNHIHIRSELVNAMSIVLNGCDNIFKYDFAPDVFCCIITPYESFLSCIDSYKLPNVKESIGKRFEGLNESFISFKNSIASIVSSSLHADSSFFQAPGFNAVQFDIPSKLLVYYTSFITELKKELTQGGSDEDEYGFIISPDIYISSYSSKLFYYGNAKNSLLNIRTSCKMLFQPVNFLTIITHEIAHYSGDEFRHRKDRVPVFLFFLISDYTLSIYKYIKNDDNDKDDTVFNKIKEKIQDEVIKWYNQIKEKQADKGSKFYYLHNLEYVVCCINQMFVNNIYNTINILVDAYENTFDFRNKSNSDLLNHISLTRGVNYGLLKYLPVVFRYEENNIHALATLLKEGYADLAATYILNFRLDDYINKFLYPELGVDVRKEKNENADNIIKKYFETDMRIQRILCVCDARGGKEGGWDVFSATVLPYSYDTPDTQDIKNNALKILKELCEKTLCSQTEKKRIEILGNYFKVCADDLKKKDFGKVRSMYNAVVSKKDDPITGMTNILDVTDRFKVKTYIDHMNPQNNSKELDN